MRSYVRRFIFLQQGHIFYCHTAVLATEKRIIGFYKKNWIKINEKKLCKIAYSWSCVDLQMQQQQKDYHKLLTMNEFSIYVAFLSLKKCNS